MGTTVRKEEKYGERLTVYLKCLAKISVFNSKQRDYMLQIVSVIQRKVVMIMDRNAAKYVRYSLNGLAQVSLLPYVIENKTKTEKIEKNYCKRGSKFRLRHQTAKQ